MKRQFSHEDHSGQVASVAKHSRLENSHLPHHSKSHRLSVQCSKYELPFPHFRKPVEIGNFSQDDQRKFHHDRRQLRFYVKPAEKDPGFNLRQGYKSLIRKDENVKEHLDDMLRWVMRNKEKFALQSEKKSQTNTTIDSLHTDFVCWRGLLTKLLCTPYENRDDWKVAITRCQGTYFLCEFETENKKRQQEQTTPQQDEMSYWGWKFEQYVTADEEDGRPDTDRPVNNNEGFCSVVRTRLHSHSLVYGGEVDAWDSEVPGDNKYIELKTCRSIDSHRQRHNFHRFKLIKWWAQSFLLGVTRIISGFRDDDGIVHSLQEFQTKDIPSLTKDLHNGWHPNVCFNFLDHVLSFIKHYVTVDDPRQVYVMTWAPGQDVQLQRAGADSDMTFLPRGSYSGKGGGHT